MPLEGEKILLVAHKSPVAIWKQLLIAVCLLFVASLSLFFGANEYLFLFALGLYIALVLYAFALFRIWFYDIYVVTNMRVVISEQMGLFHHENSEIDARDIVEVRSVRKGIASTILRHGAVVVVTRQSREMMLSPVFDPDYIAQTIRTLGSATQRR